MEKMTWEQLVNYVKSLDILETGYGEDGLSINILDDNYAFVNQFHFCKDHTICDTDNYYLMKNVSYAKMKRIIDAILSEN